MADKPVFSEGPMMPLTSVTTQSHCTQLTTSPKDTMPLVSSSSHSNKITFWAQTYNGQEYSNMFSSMHCGPSKSLLHSRYTSLGQSVPCLATNACHPCSSQADKRGDVDLVASHLLDRTCPIASSLHTPPNNANSMIRRGSHPVAAWHGLLLKPSGLMPSSLFCNRRLSSTEKYSSHGPHNSRQRRASMPVTELGNKSPASTANIPPSTNEPHCTDSHGSNRSNPPTVVVSTGDKSLTNVSRQMSSLTEHCDPPVSPSITKIANQKISSQKPHQDMNKQQINSPDASSCNSPLIGHHSTALFQPLQSVPIHIRSELRKSRDPTRRWSCTSLPSSSGYGTNTPESGSLSVSSQYSSKENLHPHSHHIHHHHHNVTSQAGVSMTTKATHPLIISASAKPSTTANEANSPVTFHQPTSVTSSVPVETVAASMPHCLTPLSSGSSASSLYVPPGRGSGSASPLHQKHLHSFQRHSGTVSPATTRIHQRSRSLSSPAESVGAHEHDVKMVNHVYKERFPKATAQMEERLMKLISDLENDDCQTWESVARFVKNQILGFAKDCLEKSRSQKITTRYFFELTDRLEKLLIESRERDENALPRVSELVNRVLYIIARPARLLECIEFDPNEFYHLLTEAEGHVKQCMHANVPKYIVSKLGLKKDTSKEGDPNVLDLSASLLSASSNCSALPVVKDECASLSSSQTSQAEPFVPNACCSLALETQLSLASIWSEPSPSSNNSSQFLESANLDAIETGRRGSFSDLLPPMNRLTQESLQRLPMSPLSSSPATRKAPTEDDFETIKHVSNGAYGAVYLVRERSTRKRFAMKKIRKQHLLLRNEVDQVFAERDILSFADNPFVVTLYCTFETRKSLCMILEYVEGGDCATLLKNMGVLQEGLAKMYFEETVLALEYLHSYGIVHRDLKPDNLLITIEGHIKLTDFGLSKIGLMSLATGLFETTSEKDVKMFRDMQVFGSPEYIAPEVILRQGYGKPVDWWAMGIILYQFLVGCVPFTGESVDEVFSEILKGKLEWPTDEEYLVNPVAQDLITALLQQNPIFRLGTDLDAQEVKEHPYFHDTDWTNILREKAAFVPHLDHEEDTSYFDPRVDRYHHHLEESGDSRLQEEVVATPTTDWIVTEPQKVPLPDAGTKIPDPKPHNDSDPSAMPVVLRRKRHRERVSSSSSATKEAQDPYHRRSSSSSDESLGMSDTRSIHEDSLFSSFTSCSPRFSRVVEQFSLYSKTPESSANTSTTSSVCGNIEDISSLPFPECDVQSNTSEPNEDLIRQNIEDSCLTLTPESTKELTSRLSELKSNVTNQLSTTSQAPSRPLEEVAPSLATSVSETEDLDSSNAGQTNIGKPASVTVQRPNMPLSLLKPTRSPRTPIMIEPSARGHGYGFTTRAIRVFYGQSNDFTLQHQVKDVDLHGPAYKAGLRHNDIVTHINDECISGMSHIDVVNRTQLRSTGSAKASALVLNAIPIHDTVIRSDGPWRMPGRMTRRIPKTDHSQRNEGGTSGTRGLASAPWRARPSATKTRNSKLRYSRVDRNASGNSSDTNEGPKPRPLSMRLTSSLTGALKPSSSSSNRPNTITSSTPPTTTTAVQRSGSFVGSANTPSSSNGVAGTIPSSPGAVPLLRRPRWHSSTTVPPYLETPPRVSTSGNSSRTTSGLGEGYASESAPSTISESTGTTSTITWTKSQANAPLLTPSRSPGTLSHQFKRQVEEPLIRILGTKQHQRQPLTSTTITSTPTMSHSSSHVSTSLTNPNTTAATMTITAPSSPRFLISRVREGDTIDNSGVSIPKK